MLLHAVALLRILADLRAPSTRVAEHTGHWSAPPEYCGPQSALLKGNTDAPLLGNGDVGVNLCGSLASTMPTSAAVSDSDAGTAAGMTWYIGKNDFWSTNNQDVTHNMYQSVANVARVSLVQLQAAPQQPGGGASTSRRRSTRHSHAHTHPPHPLSPVAALAAAPPPAVPPPYSIRQYLWNASVTSQMAYSNTGSAADGTLRTASIVAANDNVLIVEITSTIDSEWSITLSTSRCSVVSHPLRRP